MSAYRQVYPERRCLVVAVSRRSGDEIHPWLLNGDLDPDWTFERKDPLELTITPEPRLDMRFATAPIAIIIECTSGTQETFFTRSLYQDVGISR